MKLLLFYYTVFSKFADIINRTINNANNLNDIDSCIKVELHDYEEYFVLLFKHDLIRKHKQCW